MPACPALLHSAEINNGGTAILPDFHAGFAGDNVTLGHSSAEIGGLEVSGGQLQLSLTRAGRLEVGYFGTGTLNINGGGDVSDRIGFIGLQNLSTGTALVTGFGSNWTNTEQLYVGIAGTGTLNIQNDGQVMNTFGQVLPTSAFIGYYAGGHGTVTVDGPGSTFINSYDLEVGTFGTGSLSITGGSAASNFNGNIGVSSGSSGVVAVDGPGSVWLNISVVAVGISGAAHCTSPAARWSRIPSATSAERPAPPARPSSTAPGRLGRTAATSP